jgi:caffeoylshikimate esterase
LVQHGKEDKVTDPKLSQMLYDESKSHDKTIRLYEGMWHSLIAGEPPENVRLVFDDSIQWILERADDTEKKRK